PADVSTANVVIFATARWSVEPQTSTLRRRGWLCEPGRYLRRPARQAWFNAGGVGGQHPAPPASQTDHANVDHRTQRVHSVPYARQPADRVPLGGWSCRSQHRRWGTDPCLSKPFLFTHFEPDVSTRRPQGGETPWCSIIRYSQGPRLTQNPPWQRRRRGRRTGVQRGRSGNAVTPLIC